MILDEKDDFEVFENNSDRGGDSCDNNFDTSNAAVCAACCSDELYSNC